MYTKYTDKRNKEAFKIQTDDHVRQIYQGCGNECENHAHKDPKDPEGRSCKPSGTG